MRSSNLDSCIPAQADDFASNIVMSFPGHVLAGDEEAEAPLDRFVARSEQSRQERGQPEYPEQDEVAADRPEKVRRQAVGLGIVSLVSDLPIYQRPRKKEDQVEGDEIFQLGIDSIQSSTDPLKYPHSSLSTEMSALKLPH